MDGWMEERGGGEQALIQQPNEERLRAEYLGARAHAQGTDKEEPGS